MKMISIRSILYDLSLTIDPENWNESTVLEWAIKASRKFAGIHLMQHKEMLLEVKDFKSGLPEMYELKQVVLNTSTVDNNTIIRDLLTEYNGSLQNIDLTWWDGIFNRGRKNIDWSNVYETNNNYMSPCTNLNNCFLQFRQNANVLEFNFKSGVIALSYLTYALDSAGDGEYMIPDEENTKEAIVEYIRFKLADIDCSLEYSRENVEKRAYHLMRYGHIAQRAKGVLNNPTETQLMAFENHRKKIVPSSGFIDFGTPNKQV